MHPVRPVLKLLEPVELMQGVCAMDRTFTFDGGGHQRTIPAALAWEGWKLPIMTWHSHPPVCASPPKQLQHAFALMLSLML